MSTPTKSPEHEHSRAKPRRMNHRSRRINWALHDAMAEDPNVIVFGEEVADPEGGGVMGSPQGLSTKYGERACAPRRSPRQAIIGAAIGAAIAGYAPVAEIMLMNFTAVAWTMIMNHAAKLRFMSGGQTNVPLVIRTMTGAGFATAASIPTISKPGSPTPRASRS